MMFRVEITETLKRGVIVEASSSEEALRIVEDHYDKCDIVLGGDDFENKNMDVYHESDDMEPEYREGEE